MTRHRTAHRTDFSVRCACGITYNTDDQHIGKQIKCRCGRSFTIARPAKEYAETYDAKARESQAKRDADAKAQAEKKQRAARQKRVQELTTHAPRRLLAAAGSLVKGSLWEMVSDRFLSRWTARLAWLWLIVTIVSYVVLITMSELSLPATLLAYGPRLLLLVPLIVLAIIAAVVSRATLVPLTAALLVTLGPLMGARFSWRTVGRSPSGSPSADAIRVFSLNTRDGSRVARELRATLAALSPDLVALQECGAVIWDSLQAIPSLHTRRYQGLCTASRWPIESIDSMPRVDLARISASGFGGTGRVARHVISSPRGRLIFVNVHLETARKGLQGLSGDDGFIPDDLSSIDADEVARRRTGESAFEINAQIRNSESERAMRWGARGDPAVPLVVAGDFNLPVESTIYRRHWGAFSNAFEAAGTGFGWTKVEGSLLRIRIDHILSNAAGPRPTGAWVGPDIGSDHRPVIADLEWRAKQ